MKARAGISHSPTLLLAAGAALAQPTCSGDETLMSWPDREPGVAVLLAAPADSSGPNGSGLEISNVYYNGHQVLKRGHVPIVNVLYPDGGCGRCYRDWMFTEQGYLSNNVMSPGYAEPTSPCPADGLRAAGDRWATVRRSRRRRPARARSVSPASRPRSSPTGWS